ncbi:MAG: ATP-binding domain-containing protein [Chitinophagales bacterium]|nr:ATP-binding domain-containing protein [Sphingobacteriales bacterium]MBP7533166.1 ATP-binding domain-containing protein [Chitinophagales bacterium]
MAYFFELPKINDLTIGQQAALNEPNAIAISGGPGTGKSVVALWRHIRNYGTGSKRSLLLTYTKTLETYLAASATSENMDAGNAVDRTYWWTTHHGEDYDEIIVDEAQDVEEARYTTIKNYSGIVSYGADDQQILFRNKATTQQQLATIFPYNRSYVLDENFRNSYEIMHFVRALFPNKIVSQSTLNNLIQEGRRGNKPILLVSNNNAAKQTKAIIDIINQFKSARHNIAVLVPLQNHVTTFANLIRNAGIQCSSFKADDGSLGEIDNVHVTTFKSSKGTEFDTVIIPDFENMLNNIVQLNVIDENDYYVAITRAKRNLYLVSTSMPNFLERSEQQKSTYIKEIL